MPVMTTVRAPSTAGRPARQPGPRPSRHQRHAVRRRQPHDGRHVGGRARERDPQRHAGVEVLGLVVAVRLDLAGLRQDPQVRQLPPGAPPGTPAPIVIPARGRVGRRAQTTTTAGRRSSSSPIAAASAEPSRRATRRRPSSLRAYSGWASVSARSSRSPRRALAARIDSTSSRPPWRESRRTSFTARHRGCRSRIPRHSRPTAGVTRPSPGTGSVRQLVAIGPARRLVQQGVLVEGHVCVERAERVGAAEDGPDGRPERLGQVQVDGPHRPVEVDRLVHEEAGREEHLQRPQAGLVEGEAARRDERVAAQAVGVHGDGPHAGHVGVAADVVQVVDREDAAEERLQEAHPARHRRVGEGRLADEEADPRRIDRLVLVEGRLVGDRCPAPGGGRR